MPSSGSEKPCTQGFLLCHYHTRDSARGNVSSTLRGAYSQCRDRTLEHITSFPLSTEGATRVQHALNVGRHVWHYVDTNTR